MKIEIFHREANKTGKYLTEYDNHISGLNYTPAAMEYANSAWKNAVDDKLAKKADKSKYAFRVWIPIEGAKRYIIYKVILVIDEQEIVEGYALFDPTTNQTTWKSLDDARAIIAAAVEVSQEDDDSMRPFG